jgi:hypothetical protein
MIETAVDLSAKVDLRFLTDAFDMCTASGWLLLHILASIAEMERALVTEWTLAGLAAAHKKGGIGAGRRSALTRQARHGSQAACGGRQARQGGETAARRPNKPGRRRCMTQSAM